MPDFALEQDQGADEGRIVIGVDEAGCAPLAGPVTAAAVWIKPASLPAELLSLVNDCKQVSPAVRARVNAALFDLLPAGSVDIAVGWASVEEIDGINILQARLLAMSRAVAALKVCADVALIDGNRAPALSCRAEPVVGGDGTSLSIAAASIVAKVARDRRMEQLAERHPGYGWERNRGYGTAEHQAALRRLGVTAEHRRSFRPVREVLELTI